MKKRTILSLAAFLMGLLSGFAQLSEGGTPRIVSHLKKAVATQVKMPPVNNDVLRWEAEQSYMDTELKPFVFARNFDVNLNPSTDGNWMQADDGWWVWQLHIVSEDALSIALLLAEYQPGIKDRIFVYTPDQSVVMGAFTGRNVAIDRMFPVSPLPGDQLVIQYETPVRNYHSPPFVIKLVVHDFIGVVKSWDIRRPRDTAPGLCIPDINCDVAERWRDVQNSTCRIMILNQTNSELCTGTLLNNTGQNGRPFVLTANHCISSQTMASRSLFLFNYESPYCGPLDGDNSNSISGSSLRATHDSLDFSLVEISTPPPPSFRPYYAGWSRSPQVTDTVAIIHHPQGDIKKISVDNQAPQIGTFNFTSGYTPNGFWRIGRWEYGATEAGSSGGGLFSAGGKLIGNLVGGSSRCSYPFNDFFARFDIAWNNKPDSVRQLKYWLDRGNTNEISLEGRNFNVGPDLCRAFTNMVDGDVHELLIIDTVPGTKAGYWTGTNSQKITEFGDKFSIPGDERLHGVSIGVGRKFIKAGNTSSRIRINVYDVRGDNFDIIHSQLVNLADLAEDAMNLVVFTEAVNPSDSFLVAVNIDGMAAGDSIAIYQAVREMATKSSLYIRQNNLWREFSKNNPAGFKGALTVEVVACNVSGMQPIDPKAEIPLELKLYPNPTMGRIEVSANHNITLDMIQVFDQRGRRIPFQSARLTPKKIELNLAGQAPGIYIVRVMDENLKAAARILLVN